MQANRFKRRIELISATYFVHAVITNYRQASDGQLRPRVLSDRPPRAQKGLPNQIKWSERMEKCRYFFRIRSGSS